MTTTIILECNEYVIFSSRFSGEPAKIHSFHCLGEALLYIASLFTSVAEEENIIAHAVDVVCDSPAEKVPLT